MSDRSIDQLIEELVADAQAGNIEAATHVLEEIADRFDELRSSERIEIRTSAAARRSEDVEEEAIEELNEHIQEGINTQTSRAAFLLEAVSILRELEEEQSTETAAVQVEQQTAADNLSALGDQIQAQQSEYDTTAEDAAETTEEADVPAQVSVESVEAPNEVDAGEQFNVEATIQNVGDEPAEAVEVSAELYEDGERTNELTTTIGTLSGGEKASAQWSGISGIETIIGTVESLNGGTDASETDILITEQDTEPDEPSIDDYTNDDNIVDTQGLRDAIDDWRDGTIDDDKLDAVTSAWKGGEQIE